MLDKLTLMCYRFDHMKGYSPNVLLAVQIGGVITFLAVAFGVSFAFLRERRRLKAQTQTQGDDQLATTASRQAASHQSNDGTPMGGTV